MEKNSHFFFYASNSSNIEEEIIKQINKLKPLDMEPCKLFLRNVLYRKNKITAKKKLV